MKRRTASTLGAGLLAAIDLAVIMAPSVVLAAAANKGGLPNTHASSSWPSGPRSSSS